MTESESEQTGELHRPMSALIRGALAKARVLGVRIVGPPGSGKTELIESTLKRLEQPNRLGVVVVNPASRRDAERLGKRCGQVAHIDAAVPTASAVWRAILEMNLNRLDAVLVEAAGGLAPLHDLGQDATVAVFSVSGGDDKAAEYHQLLKAASAVVLTKTDLRSLVKFDPQVFRADVRSITPDADVFEVSAVAGTGMDEWHNWLEKLSAFKRGLHGRHDRNEVPPNTFFG